MWDPNDPNGGTYHDFSSADRFNFAPYNLLLTPSKRKAIFASLNYDINDSIRLHAKALYNNRTSTNQAAPEPIFVGPYAGTGGIADTIIIARGQPVQPVRHRRSMPATNFGWVTRRPVEVGPRIFKQDVDTTYFNLGLDGVFDIGNRGYSWDVNYVALGEQGRADTSSTATTSPSSSSRSAIRRSARWCRAACRSTCSAARAGR